MIERAILFLFPIAIPILMVVLLMLLSNHGRIVWTDLPGRLCYAALTFDVWVGSTITSGQKVRFVSPADPPAVVVFVIVLVHAISTVACTLANPNEPITRKRIFKGYLWGLMAIALVVYLRY